VGGTVLMHFAREQRRMNAAEHHVGTALARAPSQRVSAECVARMDANPDDISVLYGVEIQRLQRFVDDDGVTVSGGRRRRQHIQRGVMTAVPKDTSLGLTRNTDICSLS
jgi:hypothetical protein